MTSLLIISTTYAADPFNRPSCLYNLDVAAIKSATGITDTDTKEQIFEKISKKKNLFLSSATNAVKEKCIFDTSNIREFNDFIDEKEIIPIKLKVNDTLFVDIPITKESFASYLTLHTYILILSNKTKFAPGTIIKESDLETSFKDGTCVEYYLPNNPLAGTPCSDTPLSNAAKVSFDKYGHNFAIKYKNPKGELLQRNSACVGVATKYSVVEETNYYKQRENVKTFAASLLKAPQGCSGKNVAIYIIYSKDWSTKEYVIADGPFIIP